MLGIQTGPNPETGLVSRSFLCLTAPENSKYPPQWPAGTSLGLEGNFSQLFSTLWHVVYLVAPSFPHIPGRKAEQIMLPELIKLSGFSKVTEDLELTQ